jgi:hypothetical protein
MQVAFRYNDITQEYKILEAKKVEGGIILTISIGTKGDKSSIQKLSFKLTPQELFILESIIQAYKKDLGNEFLNENT